VRAKGVSNPARANSGWACPGRLPQAVAPRKHGVPAVRQVLTLRPLRLLGLELNPVSSRVEQPLRAKTQATLLR